MQASRVEANSNTGAVTAIGNVRIDYPSRQIFATSAQAQYYSQEQRIVLSGNVDVIQEGNTLQAETVTYLIEEGRFVATPSDGNQVEAVYQLPEVPPAEPAVDEPTSPAPLSIPTPRNLRIKREIKSLAKKLSEVVTAAERKPHFWSLVWKTAAPSKRHAHAWLIWLSKSLIQSSSIFLLQPLSLKTKTPP